MLKRRTTRDLPGFLVLVFILALCAALAAYIALYPKADGIIAYQEGDVTIDASHTDQGYVMVQHTKVKKTLKVRISKDSGNTVTYDLNEDGEFETFPVTLGDGQYNLQIFKQVSGKRYTREANYDFTVKLEDPTLPFLYPNQYVWYTPESVAVEKAAQLCEGLSSDRDKLAAVRGYVEANITYDYKLAKTVKSGYVPNIDKVLAKGKGICFDYSALTACMLRSQGVPTQLVIGYADKSYHAWNNVLINGQWLRVDTTAEANDMKVTNYTEERIN
jgi:transglutaminase-like putative cysteine protease